MSRTAARGVTSLPVRDAAMGSWLDLLQRLAELQQRGGSTPCLADPEPFTSESWRDRAEAAAACPHCPVLEQCRAYANANAEPAHVWAGVDRTKSGWT